MNYFWKWISIRNLLKFGFGDIDFVIEISWVDLEVSICLLYIVEFFSVFLFLDYILVLFDGCGVIFLLWFMFGF